MVGWRGLGEDYYLQFLQEQPLFAAADATEAVVAATCSCANRGAIARSGSHYFPHAVA